MHVLLTIAALTGLIAFAFGETAARGFVQGVFALVGLAILLLVWDYYREIPAKQPQQYKVLKMEFK